LGKFSGGDVNGRPIDRDLFVAYLQDRITLYNGATSEAPMSWAMCPEGNKRLFCPGAVGTVRDRMEDTSETTAVTVSPSHPFKSFWQPAYTPPARGSNGTLVDPTEEGFGAGVDPSRNGANIFNEAILFHEALHGMTGLYDDEIEGILNLPGKSLSISIYVKDSVLSACPVAQRPGD